MPDTLSLISNVFGEHMVFQSNASVFVWGFSPANSIVDVSFRGVNNASTVATADGTWRVELSAEDAGGPFTLSVVSSASSLSSITYTDVYVGTVLICSGQSNLSGDTTPVSYAFNASDTIAESSSFPLVRVFKVGELGTPGDSLLLPQLAFPPKIPWSVAEPASVTDFSATCWLTAKVLARELGSEHAIGLIESAWSGTCMQAWLPADALATCGPPPPAQPAMNTNSTLFNQIINPFGGFAIAGIVWYQGESNAIFDDDVNYYACALPAWILSWRAFFRNKNAWLGIVQLAPWSGNADATQNAMTATTRDVQLAVAAANDYSITVATAVDLGDEDAPMRSIHPRPKQELGRRLAAGALFHLFGIGALTDIGGPVYASAVAGGGSAGVLSAVVTFRPPFDAPGALSLSSVAPWPGLPAASDCPSDVSSFLCAGFQLLDLNGTWWPASGALSADAQTLVLIASTAPQGSVLRATASGWSLWPLISLYGATGGLPAYPWQHNV